MRRVLLTVVFLGVVLGAPVPAVDASPDACTGQGTMVTGYPLTYAALGPPITATWSFSASAGVCAPSFDFVHATGVITGWCDFATGRATTAGTPATPTGHDFAFLVVGLRFVMMGEVTGEASFFPDVLAGDSCVTGADRFVLWMKAALVKECLVTETQGSVALPTPLFSAQYSACA